MKKILTILKLDCEKASEFVLKKEENKLNRIEKIQLWLHAQACKLCKEFSHENNFINENLKYHFQEENHNLKMSIDKKEELKSALTEKMKV